MSQKTDLNIPEVSPETLAKFYVYQALKIVSVENENTASLAVEAIMADLADRSVIKHLIAQLHPDIEQHIRNTWRSIIQLSINETSSDKYTEDGVSGD